MNAIYCRHPKSTMDTRGRKLQLFKDLDKYKARLDKDKSLNRHTRRALLAIAREEVEKQLYTKEDMQSRLPLEASRNTRSNTGYNWEIKKKQLKGIISRKALVR